MFFLISRTVRSIIIPCNLHPGDSPVATRVTFGRRTPVKSTLFLEFPSRFLIYCPPSSKLAHFARRHATYTAPALLLAVVHDRNSEHY